MLSLFMFFIVFGTLLPTFHHTQQSIHLKKERLYAYETMHEGAKQAAAQDITSGERNVNGTLYSWELAGQLCVTYENYRSEQQEICLD